MSTKHTTCGYILHGMLVNSDGIPKRFYYIGADRMSDVREDAAIFSLEHAAKMEASKLSENGVTCTVEPVTYTVAPATIIFNL